jgi:hypothetical protein
MVVSMAAWKAVYLVFYSVELRVNEMAVGWDDVLAAEKVVWMGICVVE